MYDTLIRGGTLVDGSGAPAVAGDLAIRDGRIAAVGGRIDADAREVVDAEGCLVTPAWVDVHTHYDGQVTWDDALLPSSGQGVGTIVMGNCGVGFAPVAPGGERDLIELMEGVEDIPGTALYEGMPWGAWSTYPEYLDFLASREYALDVASLVAHGAVRNFVMGERGRDNEPATADDLERMGAIVTEALRAGAVGFSTSRILGHVSVRGQPVPGTFARDDEVLAIARALRRAERGVFQIIPSSTLGSGEARGGEPHDLMDEVALMAQLSREAARPLTFTLFQVAEWPTRWQAVLDRVVEENRRGARVHPQVGARPTGIVLSLSTYHSFMRRPTYLKLRDLPLEQRLVELRRPEIRAAILAEQSVPHELPGTMENGVAFAELDFTQTYAFADARDYEPTLEQSFAARAAAAGQDPWAFLYDHLVAGDGHDFVVMYFTNYADHDLEAVRAMQLHETTVTGLSDAGAHVTVIFDAVAPTYELTHWVRDRTRGPRLPLEHVVHRQTLRNAELFGFADRGVLAVGKRADVNVIDFDHLKLGDLEVHRDLPAGGARILQPATGYRGTWVHGVRTRDHDRDTGARPGRLLRSS
ncbi:MAG: amidohydrolase family protein [Pseudomonadales bacterium]|jgi:N-acyl-D-aspartate/D-glutamate deacylase|nr:amidohydrolase family protein [Pseudomonadales bacterium]